jgi:uncharacterized protein YjbI with pentapeptide repeats
MILDIKNREHVNSAQFVITLNFFSNKEVGQLAEAAKSFLHRDIEIGQTKDAWAPVKENGARLTRLYNKGFKMNRLTIGPVYYYEGINALIKGFKFIQENGHTNEFCNVKIDLGFSKMNEGARVEQLNKFKFLLNFNEARVFEMWPQNAKSSKLYKNSATLVYPKNRFISETFLPTATSSANDFMFPSAKRFGINFDKIAKGYISINYIGGKDYEKKTTEAVDCLNLIIESLFTTLKNNKSYSEEEILNIKNILTEQREHLLNLKSYEVFSKAFPLIKLSFDLNSNQEVLVSKFNLVREKIFDLVTYGGLIRGKINYNSTSGQVEVLEGRIKNGFNLTGFLFIDSNIQAELSNCSIFNCKIRSSNLNECEILGKSDIRYSNLNDCTFKKTNDNQIVQSTIKGQPEAQVSANLVECLVIGSPLAYDSTKDSKTEISL